MEDGSTTLKELIGKYGQNEEFNLNVSKESDEYYYNKYKILETLLGHDVIQISNSKAIEDYYGQENAKFLNPVDFVIGRIFATLQSTSKENVFQEYKSKIVFGGTKEPEYTYLVEKVKDFLENPKSKRFLRES